MTKIMRKSKYIYKIGVLLSAALLPLCTACTDWLDVKPNNEQVTTDYWKSKEDVEAVVASGYYYMRQCVPTLLLWGELRGGTFYSSTSSYAKLQNFELTSSDAICEYDDIYKVINMANSVLKYAPGVSDDTYYDAMKNAHLCEAYFLRAYCYLLLVKNYKEVPLVVEPYVDDTESFDIAKSTEDEIIAQIKSDVEAALATNAAKGTYETDWQTKGRVTKWALYALMADACVWSGDYDKAIEYCDMILNATDTFRPVFLSNTSDWYSMFCDGNTNESIFELNYDYNTETSENNFYSYFSYNSISTKLAFTTRATEKMRTETEEVLGDATTVDGRVGRMLLATYVPSSGQNTGWQTDNNFYMWKYAGTDVQDISGGVRSHQDANFIIYRVAEIIMLKAQAEVMKGNKEEAVRLINKIRNRAGLGNYNDIDPDADGANELVAQLDEQALLEEILDQKQMEFIGEGKRWYDLLWLGRIQNNKYKTLFINDVIDGNQTTNASWIQSVLQNTNAWYMPLPQDDIEHNSLLEQNSYY